MALKSATYQFKGMNRDLSNMNASKDYAYEIRNMKITANEDNTLFSISSVKGPKDTSISIKGTPIGQCVVDNQWIIFSKGIIGVSEVPDINIDDFPSIDFSDVYLPTNNIKASTDDYIYLINSDNTIKASYVAGDLNFDLEYPIEAISFVENEEIKKIYWTDGKNQPRFITTKKIEDGGFIESSDIDFIPEVKSTNNEIIRISKAKSLGMFPAGTTQYAFSYINYYGQQSNIFHISSIYYNVSNDKALEVNKTSSDSYKITINNLNNNDYQYVRIYSIVRTSQDSTPEVRVVTDYKLEDNTLEYTDRHTTGYTIDPTELFYIGGEQLVVGTMTQKDNTLFIGDITQKKEVLPENIVDQFKNTEVQFKSDKNKYITEYAGDKYYADQFRIKNTPSNGITTFKTGDYYRFGIQLMHKSGRWSEPVYIGDYQNNTKIRSDFNLDSQGNKISHFHQLVSAEAIIDDKTLLQDIKNLGYVKIRPVVVYPEFVDRSVLCQGYLSPTVYNAGERLNGGTYVQSSWFARPYSGLIDYDPTSNYQDGEAEDQHGALLEFRHNAYIGGKYTRHQEIQGANGVSFYGNNKGFSFVVPSTISIDTWKNEHSHQFFVDSSIVTMHSPEFEFDDSFKTLDLDSYKFRIVGFVPLTSHQGDIDVITSKGAWGKQEDSWIGAPGYDFVGFYKNIKSKVNYSKYGGHLLCSGVFYRDFYTYNSNKDTQVPEYTDYTLTALKYPDSPYQQYKVSKSAPMGYHIFPFHCSGNITNNPEEDDNYNTLQYKRLSNVRYSYGNIYKDIQELQDIPITSGKLFYSDQSQLLRINNHNNEQVFYSGNIDTVITPKFLDQSNHTIKNGSFRRESPQVGVFRAEGQLYTRSLNLQQVENLPYMLANEGNIQTDPIIMRYKSTPHAVISFKGDANTQNILPTINGKNSYSNDIWSNYKPFWQTSKSSYIKQQKPLYNFNDSIFEYTGLWLAELYQDIKEENIFGGKSTQAIANNKWNIAGEEVLLNTSKVTLNYTEGDTYYQRYDNLKTYPWSMEEVNGITDVISFMVETRINLEGRYDSNKADKPHFHILPSNFNLINKAYTQKNNFFEYYGVDYDRVEVNKYPNLISWSKTKTAGELTDTWLNLNLSSTLDLDGNCGKITSLQNYNGQIFAFQEKAINQILYNEQTQISTTAGVPIEIANSGKVTGYRNYSNQVGCSNKWSICQTPNGLYFLDSFNKDLYKIGESLSNLSSTNGFNTYLRSIPSIEKPWNPAYNNSIKTSYDPINKEVLFSTYKETLSYSEQLQSFMSFYDFKAEYMNTLKGDTYILGKPHNANYTVMTPIYQYQSGKYNYQDKEQKSYYVEFIANPDPLNDKIFNVLEFRSDSWDDDNTLQDFKSFNKLTIKNEYQEASSPLEHNKNLKKRFRIWKAQIPRESRVNSPLQNRIRNTWAKIKLESTENNENLNTVLHDITVHYSV